MCFFRWFIQPITKNRVPTPTHNQCLLPSNKYVYTREFVKSMIIAALPLRNDFHIQYVYIYPPLHPESAPQSPHRSFEQISHRTQRIGRCCCFVCAICQVSSITRSSIQAVCQIYCKFYTCILNVRAMPRENPPRHKLPANTCHIVIARARYT